MPTAKTSVSDPLRIAVVTPDGTQGRIGITLCPGKTDGTARFGPWVRDLDLDLDVIQHWGATALISLIEDQEFDRLSVRRSRQRGRASVHGAVASADPGWVATGTRLRDRLGGRGWGHP